MVYIIQCIFILKFNPLHELTSSTSGWCQAPLLHPQRPLKIFPMRTALSSDWKVLLSLVTYWNPLPMPGWQLPVLCYQLHLLRLFLYSILPLSREWIPQEQGLLCLSLTSALPSEWINEAIPCCPSHRWVLPSVSLM